MEAKFMVAVVLFLEVVSYTTLSRGRHELPFTISIAIGAKAFCYFLALPIDRQGAKSKYMALLLNNFLCHTHPISINNSHKVNTLS